MTIAVLLLNSVVLPLALVVRDVGRRLPRLQRHLMSQMAKHQEKNGHVYVVEDEEVDVEVEDEDVEVEDKDVEDEDVVAKVDQDRIKGALVVDSRLPLVGVGVAVAVVKDALDMALQVDKTSTEPMFRRCIYLVLHVIACGFHFLALLNLAFVSYTVWWGILHGAKLRDFCG